MRPAFAPSRRPRSWWLLPLGLSHGCAEPSRTHGSPAGQSVSDGPGTGPDPGQVASTPLLSTAQLIARDRRQFAPAQGGVLTARIPGVLQATVGPDGLSARRGRDEVALRLAHVAGAATPQAPVSLGGCAPTSERLGARCAPAAELAHVGLSEWFTSAETGVHQGWTVTEPTGDGALRLGLALGAGSVDRIDRDGRGATLTGSTGGPWRYGGLAAWDAQGVDLPAHLEGAGSGLVVVVDVAQAVWPVTVDPLLQPLNHSHDKITASDASGGDLFSESIASVGDVDGDGYDDVLVGAQNDDDIVSNGGSAYLYYGSATGLATATELELHPSDADDSANFGAVVAGAGDLDGDGYDDILVSADNDSEVGTEAGAVYVYYGSATGIVVASELKITASDSAQRDNFGHAVAAAGDLDADGYDDIVVGSPYDDDTASKAGSAYVYFGSSSGVTAASEVKLTASDAAESDLYGFTVLGAGDVDGDGYDDLAIGSPYDDDGGQGSGSVYVYLGSATGVSASSEAKLTASDSSTNDLFGASLAAVGDLDSDGRDDFMVGARYGEASAGSAYVYFGSALGLVGFTEQELVASDGVANDNFGVALGGGGDIDGDGYLDVVVGAYDATGLETDAGAVYIYYGTATGISAGSEDRRVARDGETDDWFGSAVDMAGDVDGDGVQDLIVGAWGDADGGNYSGSLYVLSTDAHVSASDGATGDRLGYAVAGAGDVDGDGYDDLVVSATHDDDGASNGGAIYVYYGTPSGVSTANEDELHASDAGNNDLFGRSVAAAGDVDGDGYDDLIVGAFHEDEAATDAGAAYVYYGSASGVSNTAEDKLTASDAAADDTFGEFVSGGGDINGDGYDDVVVGARYDDDAGSNSGSAYVYYGSALGIDASTERKLTASDAAGSDRFGEGLTSSVDVDGDGYDDVVVGAPGDDDGGAASGSAYVYYGSSTGVRTSSEEKLTASDASAGDNFGEALASAGDLDGDGYGDLVIGAPSDDDGATDAGSVYIYYGAATGIDSSSELELTASDVAASDAFGTSVSSAGDLDGDGYSDLIIGAHLADVAATDSGAVYVYFGGALGLDDATERKLDADDGGASHEYGFAVGGAGDLDGDGYDDVVVGAYGNDSASSLGGAVYVYRGDCRDEDDDGHCSADDCDDNDDTIHPGATDVVGDGVDSDCDGIEICYADADDDGHTDGSTTVASSDPDCDDSGEGLATDPDTDCDDSDATIYEGAPEIVADGIDQDCDDEEECHADGDGDGHTSGTVISVDLDCLGMGEAAAASSVEDCDDDDSSIHPGATELAGDGVDQDCDGTELCYTDADDDGYTDGSITLTSTDEDCLDSGEATEVSGEADCDDSDAAVNPGAAETVGNEVDDDCDGVEVCYVDGDNDGYTDGSSTVDSTTDADCSDSGEGLATDPTGECDDTDASIHPGATEGVGDEVDQDCDGSEVCHADADNDGYIDGSTTVLSTDLDCRDPGEGLATDTLGECDDSDASVHPGATESVGDEVDSDCDGVEECYVDADDDGFVDGTATVSSPDTDCSDSGEGLATDPTGDCDDSDAGINPGASEQVGDEVDSNCDGAEECFVDADDDGHTAGSATVTSADSDCSDSGEGRASDPDDDCDDSDATVHPGATETVGDEIDSDCDGDEECFVDADDDGYTDGSRTVLSADVDCSASGEGRATDPSGDCDDGDATIHPGATEEVGDEVDQDCDDAELCFADADGDGFVDGSTTVASADEDCTDEGEARDDAEAGDCDDTDSAVHPEAEETADDGIDQDCDGEDATSGREDDGDDGGDDGSSPGEGGASPGDEGLGKGSCASAPGPGRGGGLLSLLGVLLIGLRRRVGRDASAGSPGPAHPGE